MNLADIRIDDLLPHRDRMKLIGEIIEVDDKGAVTCATVADHWPFFYDEAVGSLVCIELVAQTAGISNSWSGIQKNGKDFVNRGWLVGIKSAVFYADTIPLNTRIVTRAHNQFELEGYREILGTVEIESKTIAEVRLQLMQSE